MQTMLSIEAAEPDVYMGLGSMAYALAKADGQLQSEELEAIRQIFTNEVYGDLALRSFLIQEYHDESVETAYAFAMRRLKASRHVLDEGLKSHLVSLLWQLAGAKRSTSLPEQALLRQFQHDLQHV